MNLTAIQSMLPILAVCAAIFFLLFLRQKQSFWSRLIQRFFVGIAGILAGNFLCASLSVGVHVGLNPATLLTGTILGFPGVVALFVLPLL